MTRYLIRFFGRKVNAIGLKYKYTTKVEAEDVKGAVLKLYDEYEHCSDIRLNKIMADGKLDPLTLNHDGKTL